MKTDYLIIDRFEGGDAVCETQSKKFIYIDRTLLPDGARECDAIRLAANGQYELDDQAGRTAKERISRKMNELWK